MNIKKDDKVVVLSGKDKGKEGKVLSADPKGGKLIVEGVNVATKHQKPKNQQDQGGIIKTETPIYACKVMVVCPKCGKPTRVAHKITDGKKARICKKCGAERYRREQRTMANMPSMKKKYVEEVAPALMTKFQYESVMQIPKIEKIVVSVGCGDCKDNAKALDAVIKDITAITGQHAVATVAKKSVANFKLREGMHVGVKVTLRQDRMWEFLDRLFNIALPRVRDFRGISADAFDGRGNYSLGLKEQIIFPEIEYDKIEKLRGMNIAIITTAKTDEEARELLKLMGAPFVTKA